MSMLEASRTFEPVPPRPLALRPSPSARNVVGKWGISAGSTMATPRAPTPTTRPSVANAVVGSASGPDEECGDAVPQARSERTPCRPTRASQARAAGHGVPGAQAVAGVGRRGEEGRQQRDAGQRRAAVRHADGVDRDGGQADEQADRQDRGPVGRRRGGVVGDRRLRLLEQHPEGAPGLRGRQQAAEEVPAPVHQRRRVDEQHHLAHARRAVGWP